MAVHSSRGGPPGNQQEQPADTDQWSGEQQGSNGVPRLADGEFAGERRGDGDRRAELGDGQFGGSGGVVAAGEVGIDCLVESVAGLGQDRCPGSAGPLQVDLQVGQVPLDRRRVVGRPGVDWGYVVSGHGARASTVDTAVENCAHVSRSWPSSRRPAAVSW